MAMAVMLLSLLLLACEKRSIWKWSTVICALVAIIIMVTTPSGVNRAIIATFTGNVNVSQQRSSDGRIAIWRERLGSVKQHPLIGSGGYTDGLESLSSAKRNDDMPFTARAYNGPLQLLLNSGLLGLVAYSCFFIHPFIRYWKSIRSPEATVILGPLVPVLLAGVASMLVRDLTYSSLVIHGATIFIAWVTIALVQNVLDSNCTTGTLQ